MALLKHGDISKVGMDRERFERFKDALETRGFTRKQDDEGDNLTRFLNMKTWEKGSKGYRLDVESVMTKQRADGSGQWFEVKAFFAGETWRTASLGLVWPGKSLTGGLGRAGIALADCADLPRRILEAGEALRRAADAYSVLVPPEEDSKALEAHHARLWLGTRNIELGQGNRYRAMILEDTERLIQHLHHIQAETVKGISAKVLGSREILAGMEYVADRKD